MTTVDTVKGCDNGDIEMQVDLQDEPDCSTLVMRLALWSDRDENNVTPPHEIYEYDDWVSLDLADMRTLRAALDEKIAQVEAHDAALNAAYDDEPSDVDGNDTCDTDGM